MNSQLLLLLIASAVLGLSSCLSVPTTPAETEGEVPVYIDGVDVTMLSEKDLRTFVDIEDEELKLDLDIHGYINSLDGRPRRQKRLFSFLVGGLWFAGKALFWGAATNLAVSRVNDHIYRSYIKPVNSANRDKRETEGCFEDALRDFNSFNPRGITSSNTTNSQVRMGTVGQSRFFLRRSSSSDCPTLEILTTKGDGTFVRKIKYVSL